MNRLRAWAFFASTVPLVAVTWVRAQWERALLLLPPRRH